MTKIVSSFIIITIGLGVLLQVGHAQAQSAMMTWVSGAGSDSYPCTRASPCATFSAAYAQTAAGGEIDVLDGGDFGPLFIQRALTIANDGAGVASITPGSGAAIVVNAGTTDAVILRGLTLNGLYTPSPGIVFQSGARWRGALLECATREAAIFAQGRGAASCGQDRYRRKPRWPRVDDRLACPSSSRVDAMHSVDVRNCWHDFLGIRSRRQARSRASLAFRSTFASRGWARRSGRGRRSPLSLGSN
jgi:hypothetical protein